MFMCLHLDRNRQFNSKCQWLLKLQSLRVVARTANRLG
jgi:hypothetical protein